MVTDDQRRSIGKIVYVAADRFVVELHWGSDNFTVVGFDDVHYIARLGSFVLIPVQAEYVVAEIVGLREKESATLDQGKNSDGMLDKSRSAKFLDVVPVGTLPQEKDGPFRFGVSTFPSLYADALYALDENLDRIFEVSKALESSPLGKTTPNTRYRAISIGTSAVFHDYDSKIKVDEFFGGHAAILGNTGSGKSCTVATILQSLFDKNTEHVARGATFIILDVNGEYRHAFSKLPSSIHRTYFKIGDDPHANPPTAIDEYEETAVFRLPHWFMSVEEWELLLRASERTQQPVLRTALGLSTLFSDEKSVGLEGLRDHILASSLLHVLQSDAGSPTKKDRITALLTTYKTAKINLPAIRQMIAISYGEMKDPANLTTLLESCISDDVELPDYSNQAFEFESLLTALDLALLYEEAHGNRQIRDYCSQLITRFKWIKERQDFAFLRVSKTKLTDRESTRKRYIERFLAIEPRSNRLFKKAQIVILDMNDAPDEVVEVASAVIARLVFERLRRANPRNQLPTNLILEEAHRYVAERPSGYAIDASRIFERIAKEGRKYGMFLMLASQRPCELSKTVLSQCSNFVVHRIQNPDDLAHIRQMTPFVSESVLRRLPSLPKQHALIFGNAVNLPSTFRVRNVDPKPLSDDARIRDIWFRGEEEPLDFESSM